MFLTAIHLNGSSPAADFYPVKLFHGPLFQVIRSVEAMGDQGATAILKSTETMAWTSASPWQTDVALIDGALQVLRLWTTEQLKVPSLPTRIGQFISYTNESMPPYIQCVAQCRTIGKLRTVASITLADLNGMPLAQLNEVEMHVTAEAD